FQGVIEHEVRWRRSSRGGKPSSTYTRITSSLVLCYESGIICRKGAAFLKHGADPTLHHRARSWHKHCMTNSGMRMSCIKSPTAPVCCISIATWCTKSPVHRHLKG